MNLVNRQSSRQNVLSTVSRGVDYNNNIYLLKGAMSPVAHALASENKLEKDGPSFSSSVGDFGRLFLAVEISAIVR